MANTGQYGLDALAHIRLNVKAAVDLPEGSLFGLDANGEAILADAGTPVRAIGVVVDGSLAKWGAEKVFNNASVKTAGDYLDANKYAQVEAVLGTYSYAQIGVKLYLGAGGAFTLTENSTSTELNQVVGYVATRSTVVLDLTIDTEGAIVA